jgi:hypothetical protein
MTTLAPVPLLPRSAAHGVKMGSLTMAASAQKNVAAAFAYLSHDDVERGLIDTLLNSSVTHHLTINHHDDDSYDPSTHTIHWDPHSALLTTLGGHQSPALGLGHEIDHAVENPLTAEQLNSRRDPNYDTLEERRVITGSEQHAARTLGESIRFDHSGSCYSVASPTMRRSGFSL